MFFWQIKSTSNSVYIKNTAFYNRVSLCYGIILLDTIYCTGCANNRYAGDLRHHRAHSGVTVIGNTDYYESVVNDIEADVMGVTEYVDCVLLTVV